MPAAGLGVAGRILVCISCNYRGWCRGCGGPRGGGYGATGYRKARENPLACPHMARNSHRRYAMTNPLYYFMLSPTNPNRRYGSLRSYDSAMALHALQPALRKPWLCPGCGVRLVASYGEVRQHVEGCEAVRGVEAQAVETLGYAQAATGGPGGGRAGRGGAAAAGAAGGGGEGGGQGDGGQGEDHGPLAVSEGTQRQEKQQKGEQKGGATEARGGGRVGEGEQGGGGGRVSGGEQGGGGGEGVALGMGAMVRLEEYLGSEVRWGRRRAAVQGAEAVVAAGGGRGAGRERWEGERGGGGGAGQGQGGMPSVEDAAAAFLRMAEKGKGPGGTGEARAGEGASGGQAGGPGAGSAGAGAGAPYTCPVCGLTAHLTPPQILLHKRSHAA